MGKVLELFLKVGKQPELHILMLPTELLGWALLVLVDAAEAGTCWLWAPLG